MLSNSAFSSYNLFPSAPAHIPTRRSSISSPPHSPTLLTHRPKHHRASSKSSIPPSIPARYSSINLPLAESPPFSPDFYTSSRLSPKVFIPLDSPIMSDMSPRPFSVIDLGSPCVISGEYDAEAKPGSVHVGKQRLVNWARPFQGDESESQIQIFGQSAQRARRMKKSHSANAFPSPTPSSSDDEPLPLTPQMDMNRSWTIATELTGLGVKGIKEFESLHLDEIRLDSPTSTSPVLYSIPLPSKRRAPAPARLLNSSQSLNSLAAPSNLAELRRLQQAAVDLQYEANRPFKLSAPKERRIRRKAVPSVPEEGVDWSQTAGPSRSHTLDVATPVSDAGSSLSSTPEESPFMQFESPILEPVTPRRETPMRRFYGNAKATMSMIDVSPRSASLPIYVPPRAASKNHQRATSDPVPSPALSLTRKTSSDLSDSGESWDQPVTPDSFSSTNGRVGGNGFQFAPMAKAKKTGGGIYGNKSAFLSQLDLGLKRVLERKEVDEDKKKRGLGRFLGRK